MKMANMPRTEKKSSQPTCCEYAACKPQTCSMRIASAHLCAQSVCACVFLEQNAHAICSLQARTNHNTRRMLVMCVYSQHPCVMLAGCLQDAHLAHEKIEDQHAKKRNCNLGFVELFGLNLLSHVYALQITWLQNSLSMLSLSSTCSELLGIEPSISWLNLYLSNGWCIKF